MARFDLLEIDPAPEPSRGSKKGTKEFDEQYWFKLADQNRREGLYENALRFYSRALELDKSQLDGWLGQVQMLVYLNESKEAELWARKALELFRNHGDLLAARAHALSRLGEDKVAHGLSDASLRSEGGSWYRWLVRGEILLAGKEDLHRYCFDKATGLSPDWLVPLEIAAVCMHHGRYSFALPRLRKALEQEPESTHLWYLKARCEMKLDLKVPASASLKRCLEINPKHVEAQKQLALLPEQGWSLGRSLKRLFGRS